MAYIQNYKPIPSLFFGNTSAQPVSLSTGKPVYDNPVSTQPVGAQVMPQSNPYATPTGAQGMYPFQNAQPQMGLSGNALNPISFYMPRNQPLGMSNVNAYMRPQMQFNMDRMQQNRPDQYNQMTQAYGLQQYMQQMFPQFQAAMTPSLFGFQQYLK